MDDRYSPQPSTSEVKEVIVDSDEVRNIFKKFKKQARKGFRPISASEGLLVRKVNNLINKRTEHWSCRIFVQQVK